MKKILMLFLLGIPVLMLHAELPTRTVEVEGVGETVEEALHNARRNAVRKAFGEVVDSTAELRNEKFNDANVSASSGFIMSYEKLGEPEHLPASAAYKVKIRAVVATEKVGDRVTLRSSTATGSIAVETEGSGGTLKEAMRDAHRNAVRKALGEVVDSVTELQNEKLLESTISASSGFVLSSKVVGDPKYDARSQCYTVRIKAVVSRNKLKDMIIRFKKSSTAVDIASQLKTSDDAEVQEKNAMQLFLWYYSESHKALTVSDFSYSAETGTPVIGFTVSVDRNKLGTMTRQFKKGLIANGYRKIKQQYNEPHCYRGSVFAFTDNDASTNNHNDIYNNPNVLLFWGPYNDKNHPQNVYFQRPRWHYEIDFVDRQGNRNAVIKDSSEDHPFFRSYRYDSGSSSYEKCSFMGLVGKNDFRFWKDRWRPTVTDSWRWSWKLPPPENFGDVEYVEVAIVLQDANNGEKRFVLNKFRLNARDVTTQIESLADRSRSYEQIFVNIYRNIYRCLTPSATFTYNRFKKTADITVSIEMDRRKYFSVIRKFERQFSKLGISPENNWKAGHFNVWYAPRGTYASYCFPDPEHSLTRNVGKALGKYSYSLRIKFKDALGDVLQEESLSIPQRPVYCVIGFESSYGILTVKKPEGGSYVWSIPFDVPENLKKIKTVECYIEETVKQ